MRRTLFHCTLAGLCLTGCGENAGSEAPVGQDTTESAAIEMVNPAGGAAQLGDPLFMAAFREGVADTADEVTGALRVYADAGPADAMAAKDRPTAADGMMDAGAAEDAGSTVETAGVESPAAGSGGGFRLAVVLDGLSPGGHAWHIHAGPCGQQAPVVVPFTPTPDHKGIAHTLNADAAGTARALVTVPPDQLTLEQVRQGEYSVHVHLNPGTDHGPTVACANMRSGDAVEG